MVTTLILFLLINGYFVTSFAFFRMDLNCSWGCRRNLAQGAGSAKTGTAPGRRRKGSPQNLWMQEVTTVMREKGTDSTGKNGEEN